MFEVKCIIDDMGRKEYYSIDEIYYQDWESHPITIVEVQRLQCE